MHLLYGSEQLSEVGRLTAALGCVYTNCTKLGCPVARCTPCVRFPGRSLQLIVACQTIYIERYFVDLLCGSVQLPKVGLRTALSGCVYTNCTKLRGLIATCTRGVRPLDCYRIFTRPWQTIWSERHFHTPPVRICTIP